MQIFVVNVISFAQERVVVLHPGENLFGGEQKIGSVRIGDQWRIDCGLEKTLALLKLEAEEKGGNLIVLTDIDKPDSWSTCYRISADVFVVDEISRYLLAKKQRTDSFVSAIIADTASHSVLYVYRPDVSAGAITRYNVKLNGQKICRVKNGTIHQYRVESQEKALLWTDMGGGFHLNIERGKVYFLRCTVQKGIMSVTPVISIVPADIALSEISALKK